MPIYFEGTNNDFALPDGVMLEWTIFPSRPWVIRLPDGRAAKSSPDALFSHFNTIGEAMRWAERHPKRLIARD